MFTQSAVMFYLIGSGKKIKELTIGYNLDTNFYERAIKIKRELFPALTINMLIVGTGFILGGGVQTKVISKYWHYFIFYLGLIHYIKVILIQHKSLIVNADILSDLGEQLNNKEVI
tara:strand:- start:159 stop:506 length:348 start_codon:yes stop_codon:yes gene_type:complete